LFRVAPAFRPGAPSRPPRVLLLIPSVAKTGIAADVAADRHPTMDYHALQAELGADLADYRTMEECAHPVVRLAARGGQDAELAAYGFVKRREYDAIFSNGENVGIPLAALFRAVGRRPAHVVIGHRVTPAK